MSESFYCEFRKIYLYDHGHTQELKCHCTHQDRRVWKADGYYTTPDIKDIIVCMSCDLRPIPKIQPENDY